MAAKSIINVEVDKEGHFKDFVKNFEKFEQGQNRTVLNWKKTNLETFTMVESLKTVVQTLNEHSGILQRIASGTTATATAAQQMAQAWQQAANASAQVNQNVNGGGGGGGGGGGTGGGTGGGAGGSQQSILGGFASGAARGMGIGRVGTAGAAGAAFIIGQKLVEGIGSVISSNMSFLSGLAGMGGNLFGLDRLAAAGGAGLRASRGLGLDYGSMKAAQNVFGANFDPNRAMESLAGGRADITSDQYRAMAVLGIQGGNTGDNMMDLRMKFRQFAQETPEELLGPLMKAYGYDQFFTTQDARRFKAQPLHEFNEDTQMMRKQAELAQVRDKDLRLWQQFSLTLQGAENTIQSSLIKGLAPLAPELTKISEALSEAISSLLGSQGFKDIIDIVTRGLRSFAEYVKSDDFRKDIVWFGQMLKSLADTMKGIIDWWNGSNREELVNEKGYVVAYRDKKTGEVRDAYEGNVIGRGDIPGLTVKPTTSSTTSGGSGSGTSASVTSISGTQTSVQAASNPAYAQYIQHLMGKGWSYNQALGMVANIHEESGGNPNLPGDNGTAWGLAQWRGERQANFKKQFGIDIQKSTWQQQLDFMDWELRNTHQIFKPGESITEREAYLRALKQYEIPRADHMAARSAGNTVDVMRQAHPSGMMVPTKVIIDNQNPSSINVQTQSVWQAI